MHNDLESTGVRMMVTVQYEKFSQHPFRPTMCCSIKNRKKLLLSANGTMYELIHEHSNTWAPIKNHKQGILK